MSGMEPKREADRLDDLLFSAQSNQVSPRATAAAIDRVKEHARWYSSYRAQQRRSVWAWSGMSVLVTAAIAVFVLWPNFAPSPVSKPPLSVQVAPSTPLQIGSYVAIVADEAEYRVLRTSDAQTELEVLRGTVTARLFHDTPNDHRHKLVVRAKDVEVTAVGTVFSVGVTPEGKGYSVVHEGEVKVRQRAAKMPEIALSSGGSFPVDTAIAKEVRRSAATLQTHELPKDEVDETDTTATANPVTESPEDSPIAKDPEITRQAPSNKQLWRQARALRSQGNARDALERLKTLQSRQDTTWTPLAHFEEIRIRDAEMMEPKVALRQVRVFLARYPAHGLHQEALALLCRLATQLQTPDPLCPNLSTDSH